MYTSLDIYFYNPINVKSVGYFSSWNPILLGGGGGGAKKNLIKRGGGNQTKNGVLNEKNFKIFFF